MKSITITIMALLVSITSFAQDFSTFAFEQDGSTFHVVHKVDKAKASELYNKTFAWVNETYKNPDAVVKAKIENEMIRINGFMKDAFTRQLSTSTAGYDCNYTLTIEFQDGKYRMKFDVDEITVDSNKVRFTLEDVVNNKPDVNGRDFSGSLESFEKSVNDLLNSLYVYQTKPKESW